MKLKDVWQSVRKLTPIVDLKEPFYISQIRLGAFYLATTRDQKFQAKQMLGSYGKLKFRSLILHSATLFHTKKLSVVWQTTRKKVSQFSKMLPMHENMHFGLSDDRHKTSNHNLSLHSQDNFRQLFNLCFNLILSFLVQKGYLMPVAIEIKIINISRKDRYHLAKSFLLLFFCLSI